MINQFCVSHLNSGQELHNGDLCMVAVVLFDESRPSQLMITRLNTHTDMHSLTHSLTHTHTHTHTHTRGGRKKRRRRRRRREGKEEELCSVFTFTLIRLPIMMDAVASL